MTFATVFTEFIVDHRGDRHRRPVGRLWHDAPADRFERVEFCQGQEPRLARQGEPGVDDLARLLVPRRRMPLREYVVAGKPRAHCSRSISLSAASPAIANAVN